MDDSPAKRLHPAIYALGFGIFCLGTSEFMLAGILPQLAHSLGVGIPSAGMLITAFAVGMLIGAPLMTAATLRVPARACLIAATVLFALAHLVVLVSDSYAVVLISRVVSAVVYATYWAVAAATALRLAPAGARAKAMAVVVGGLTVANVLGVPIGTWIGERWGWRATFVAVAVASVVAAVVLVRVVPARTQDGPPPSARREIGALRNPRLWLALAITAAFQATVFCTFSYLTPLLTTVSELPVGAMPLILFGFGLGSLAGVTIGGRLADRNLLGNMAVSLVSLIVTLLLLASVAGTSWLAVPAVILFGVAGFSIAAALNARTLGFAGDAPTMAAAVNTSAFNVGNAIGPWLGGVVISAGLGYRAPVLASVGLGLTALLLTGLAWAWERRDRRATADHDARVPLTCSSVR